MEAKDMSHTATVNISFPKDLLRYIDEVAHEESRTRSELLREATRMYIERKRRWKSIFAFWRTEAKARGITPSSIEQAIHSVRSRKQ
jgi:CopG family transcriptional regulator / antitoxin EndoAI